MTNDKQQQAHDLYFATDKTQQEIADLLDLSRKTINGWVRKNRWDEMKAATKHMPSFILRDLYTHINAINDRIFNRDESDRCPTMQEVSMLNRLLNMTKSIQKQHTGSYMEAFQELQLFVFNRDSDLALQLRDHIGAYTRGTLGDKEFMARKRRKDNVLEATANLAKQEIREEHWCATLPKCGTPPTQHHPIPQECNPNVTSCNPLAATQHISDYVETRCVASLPAQECNPNVTSCNPTEHHRKGNTHHDNHVNQANQGSDNVPSCNPAQPGVPYFQSVATPPKQHNPLPVQTGCSPSPLAQSQCNPNVTFCNPGVPHFQSVATPPTQHENTQHDPLVVQTGYSPSPLAQDQCNPNVTSCNPLASTQHISDYVEMRCAASLIAQECNPNVTSCNPAEHHRKGNTHYDNHVNQANQGSDNVTSRNPAQSGVSHFQSVATPPMQHENAQHDPLPIQNGYSPSPLPQNGHILIQGDPLNHANHGQECNQNVTFCSSNEQPKAQPENPSRVFTVAANGDITVPQAEEKCNILATAHNVTSAITSETHRKSCTSFYFENPDIEETTLLAA